ncbi:MAG: hypothetical protein JXO51_06390 [Candidatus Aminicenantes bacterium]|nr:hypothetical protein [Candidatus Aminicenantes bacterium]
MKKNIRRFVGLLLVVGFVAACGGPKTVQFQKLGLSVQLPSGWKADAEEDASKYSPLRVELRCQDRRTVIVSKYEIKADNFAAMEKALASQRNVTIQDKEEIEGGFGFTYEKKGKKLFLYFLTFGDTTYKCEPNEFYYDEKDIPAAIEVIKSIKKA